jgi:hypothetical protein
MAAGGASGSALAVVMHVWTERQIELRGLYNINLTSTALALLLASRHPALAEIQVGSCNLTDAYDCLHWEDCRLTNHISGGKTCI